VTLEDVAKQLRWHSAKLSRLERAEPRGGLAGPAEVIALATILGIDEAERDRVVSLAIAGADNVGWWRAYTPGVVPEYFADYLETESEASSVSNVDSTLVPGLLQTAAYTDALQRGWQGDAPQVDTVMVERRELRQQRQARLDEDGTGKVLALHSIIDEAALRRLVGGPAVMAEQLDVIARRAAQPSITVQVLAAELGAYPGLGVAFRLLRFDDESSAVYIETLDSGLYVEEPDNVAGYLEIFERLTTVALDPETSLARITGIGDEWRTQITE
jgi:hypothetical protein